jgi:hypothetical protein
VRPESVVNLEPRHGLFLWIVGWAETVLEDLGQAGIAVA